MGGKNCHLPYQNCKNRLFHAQSGPSYNGYSLSSAWIHIKLLCAWTYFSKFSPFIFMLMPYTVFVYSSLKPHILINALILLLNSLLIFMLFLFSSVLLRRNIIHVWRMTSTKGMIRLNSIHTSISFMEPVRGRESDTLINLVKIIVKAWLQNCIKL